MKTAEEAMRTDLPLYRDRTRGVLRRYFQLAVETGRLPSLLGREFFRARVSSYRLHTFEDAVIFTHDVERCLARLDESARQVLARIVLQGHTEEEAARLLHCSRRHIVRLYPEALDKLSAVLLEMKLLKPFIGLGDFGTEQDDRKTARARTPRRSAAQTAVARLEASAAKRGPCRVDSCCQGRQFTFFAASA